MDFIYLGMLWMRTFTPFWIACAAGLIIGQPANAQREPIIDVHLHALETLLTYGICPGTGVLGVLHADGSRVCETPLLPASSPEALRIQTLEAMQRNNIVGVIMGNIALVEAWKRALPERVIPASATETTGGDLSGLRSLVESGRIAVVGETGPQYEGLAPNDPKVDPLYALAQELDVPIGMHVAGIGAPVSSFRAALGDPLLLEDVLLKYPRLRLYVMHAGYPFIDRMIALMRRHPQLYLDISWIVWQMPRAEFHAYLKRLMDHGFGKRIMFGTDQVAWPAAIDIAIDVVKSAPFLTSEQRRDIFYNNAARFLRIRPLESQPPNEELNLTGALRRRLARGAREPHLIGSAGRLTPAR